MGVTTYYNGKIVPEKLTEESEFSCEGVYCIQIKCTECILFPTIETVQDLHDYLFEEGHNVRIGEGITRVLYDSR